MCFVSRSSSCQQNPIQSVQYKAAKGAIFGRKVRHILREAFANLSVYCYYMNMYLGRRSVAIIPVLMCCCSSIQPPTDWAVPQSSRLKYRQLFNSHDKMMSGHLTGTDTRRACFHWSPYNCCVCPQHCSPSFL